MTAEKLKPDWAGEDFLSRLVNLLIRTKPIYALMKQQARQVLIKTAEKNGIPWRQTVAHYSNSNIQQHLASLTHSSLPYPDYYQVPFHAYDDGNLCWLAAFEAAPATYSMALRVWPDENLSYQEAQERLRASFHAVLAEHGPKTVKDILDIGCSVGISTLTLHRFYTQQQSQSVNTLGVDLSPYMLAIAQESDANHEISQWIHANAEELDFSDQSFDVVSLQFVIHELPRVATTRIFQEIFRLLRPGGVVAIVDNNPKSAVIQKLPPVLFTLMKSTEPWSDDYYTFSVESALRGIGFEQPITVESDPRHRTIIARKPLSG
jgi:ubiquinone/menaquinone biosynthesis C-methylase UbiE